MYDNALTQAGLKASQSKNDHLSRSTENYECGQADSSRSDRSPLETIADALDRRIGQSYNDTAKMSRVAEIMRRHPEFEEFLVVLRSGLV